MWETIIKNLPLIITALIAIGAIRNYANKALKLIKEVEELLVAIVIAFADRKLTQEELDKIVKEAKDIPHAVLEMINRGKKEEK